MDTNIPMQKEDEILLSLMHYFVTEENYSPILVQGVKNEVWLERVDGPYRIIRINNNYIHNEEQFKFDQYKIQDILRQIKKKTVSFKVNALNFNLNVNDSFSPKGLKGVDNVQVNDFKQLLKNDELTGVFPKMKDGLCLNSKGMELMCIVANDVNSKTKKENSKFEKIIAMKKPIVTYVIMALCILMFLVEFVFGGTTSSLVLLLLGANSKGLVVAGQVWRLLTYAFLHAGIFHLLANMYSLFIIGPQIESHFGKIKFLIVYLISAICGGLLSTLFSTSISIGASGAIFGLMGAMVYFGMRFRLYLRDSIKTKIVPVIILNLLLGFLSTGVDNACHIGGLIGGYLAAMIVSIPEYEDKKDRINGIILLTIFVAFMVYLVFFR